MKKIHVILFTMATFILSACNNSKTEKAEDTQATSTTSPSHIFPKGEKIENDYFSGIAWHQRLVTDRENFDVTVGNVLFESGVRNNWHSHPGGQILICIRGTGYYQEKSKPIQRLGVGDVVEILPDVIHWHGATPHGEFEHLAIGTQTHKGAVVWMEPVTDEEYNSFEK
jgi:quercetin dioxygenase-like cupin family protein